MVARMDACEPVPVLTKDLFEDVPGRQGCCSHQAASLRSVGLSVIALFYHILPTTSTPSSAYPPARSLPSRPKAMRCAVKWKFLDDQDNWLRVLSTAERAQIDHRVPQKLHAIVALLDTFKAESQPLELVLPGKGPLNPQA